MIKKTVKNFLFVLFLLNVTFVDAILPDYEYNKKMSVYFKVYIDELAEQQIEEGLHTEETINEFRQEKENKYLFLLNKIRKNKKKPQINFEFDKKFPKKNKEKLLNLVAVLLEAGELNEDGVNGFIRPRHDRIVNYRKTKGNQCQKKRQQSDAYKEIRKKYEQSDLYKETQKKYRESDEGKEIRKKYEQSDTYKEIREKYRKSDACKEAQKRYRQSDKGRESQKRYRQSDKGREYRQSDKCRESEKKYKKSDKYKETSKKYYQCKKLLAQQGDKNEQQGLLNKTQSLNDGKDAFFEPNIECSFDIPTPQTPLAVQYLLDLYQNGKSSASFDEAVEDAIYEDDPEYQNEILEDDDMVLSGNILAKRGKFECENSSSDDDNEPKRSKFE